MSEAKCPLCSGDLIQSEEFPCFYSCQSTNWKSDADKLCELDDCAASVPVWETLRRTRKALDVAKSKLNGIHRLYSKAFYTREDWLQVCMEMVDKANTALEQITAQEQKDHFADASKKVEQKDKQSFL